MMNRRFSGSYVNYRIYRCKGTKYFAIQRNQSQIKIIVKQFDPSHSGCDLVNDVLVLVEVKGVLVLEVEGVLGAQQAVPGVLPFESNTNLQHLIYAVGN